MATIDPSIALGVKPIQLEDPINRFARQQELSVNMLKAQEMQRAVQNRNMLAQLNPSDPDYVDQVYRVDPELGMKVQKSRFETKKQGADLDTVLMKNSRDMLTPVNNQDSYNVWRAQTISAIPTLANLIPAEYSPQNKASLLMTADKYLDQIAPTSAIKEYKYSQEDPGFAEFQLKQRRAGATQVVLPSQEKAEQTERGKFLVEDYKGVSNAAKVAARTLPAIETNIDLLDKGFKTGFSTEVQKGAANILGALGVKDAANFATNAQVFSAKANETVLQRQLEQKGPQTEADAQRITQTGAQLTNTADANRFILDVAKAQLKRDIEQRNFYDSWWKKNKTYDGAEDAWYSGNGGKSLFERPELRQYNIRTDAPVAAAGKEVARQGKVTSGPNQGKTVIEYTDGTREYK